MECSRPNCCHTRRRAPFLPHPEADTDTLPKPGLPPVRVLCLGGGAAVPLRPKLALSYPIPCRRPAPCRVYRLATVLLLQVLDIRGCPEPQGGVMQQQVRRFTDTHLRGGDRLVRYSAVYGAYAGSIPVRRATSLSLSSSRPRTLTSQARDRGPSYLPM